MSEFHVRVVQVGDIQKHPNADNLSTLDVEGYPVIIKTGDFKPGDLAVYIPIDAIVPETEAFAFLGGHRRIKARRLRGIFSMGLLMPASILGAEVPPVGTNVQEALGIEKYDPETSGGFETPLGENMEPDPGFLPKFTDIEGLRKYATIIEPGTEVVLTEKIHGASAKYVFRDGRLWVASNRRFWKPGAATIWNQAATDLGLAERLARVPNIAIYGEVYGQVQDLKYGVGAGVRLALFDALDTTTRRYLDFDEFTAVAKSLDLPTVPVLYRGPWSNDLRTLAEGKSTMADHVREGFVVRPVKEMNHRGVGRVIFKMVGEGYLLRKAA